MNFRIVTDSSSNVLRLDGENYASVPMKIVTSREYIDNPDLNVAEMIEDLKTFRQRSGSSCPNIGEWLEAFADAPCVFCVTITKHLSGSYSAAREAAATYLYEHPDRKVFVFDSLSAGPELMLIVNKIRQCEGSGDDFETTTAKVLDYHNHLHTLFCLESMTNLARNGRVNPIVAKLAGTLGIHVAGDAKGGELSPVHKPRGVKKTIRVLVEMLKERGFRDGAVLRVAHCFAEDTAYVFRDAVLQEFPHTRFSLEPTTALCSFYAETGGLIIAFEGGFNMENDNTKF